MTLRGGKVRPYISGGKSTSTPLRYHRSQHRYPGMAKLYGMEHRYIVEWSNAVPWNRASLYRRIEHRCILEWSIASMEWHCNGALVFLSGVELEQ